MFIFLAIFCYQYNMGACINESAKKLKNNLKSNSNSEKQLSSLISKLCWSKNISKERDAPDHISIGSEHWYYCILTCLASWLKRWIEEGFNKHTNFLFGIDGLKDPDAIKRLASLAMKNVLDDSTFDTVINWEENEKEKRETYSLNKLAADITAKNGVLRDHIDLR